MADVMIDIETLGTVAGCAPIAVGWAVFDPDADGVESTGCRHIDIDTALAVGLKVEGGSLRWWMDQGAEQRAAFQRDSLDIATALRDFGDVVRGALGGCVWSKDAAFDIPILEYAYRACGLLIPWDYRAVRCVRTVVALAGLDPCPSAHVADEDARIQAIDVQRTVRTLRRED